MGIEINRFVLGNVSTNCYIISNNETKEALVIDPADNAQRIRDIIVTKGFELKAILLTHGHFDHILAANDLLSNFHVPVYCHEKEQELLSDPEMNLSAIMSNRDYILKATDYVRDNEELTLIGEKIKVLYTPGHTQGGVCYYFVDEKCMFVGDTIFFESVGRTDFPTGNARTLIQSINEKLYGLDDEIVLYSGHGPATSIGHEKENNPYTSEEVF